MQWSFDFEICSNVEKTDDGVFINEYEVPDNLVELFQEAEDADEVVLHCHCNASSLPGCWYLNNGDPGYPPEQDEEVYLLSVAIGDKVLTPEIKLFDALERFLHRALIDNHEIDYPEAEYDDYEPGYEDDD